MVGIVDPLDAKSDEPGFGDPVSAAAGNGPVNWANFAGTESHDISPGGLSGIAELNQVSRTGEALRRGCPATISARGELMSNLAKVVQQLRQERDQAQKRIEQLDEALKALTGLDGIPSTSRRFGRGQTSPGKHRTMSAAARKRIAAAQRARWAKWKAAQRGK
jgi:hypothetical protein